MTEFYAQTMLDTARTADGRLEVTFAGAAGEQHTLSMPLIIAGELAIVFAQIKADAERPASPGRFYRALEKWAVGRTDHPSAVLLSVNDEQPYMLDGEDAMNLGGILREVGEKVMAEAGGKLQ